ncbi:MAG TPA: ABC transporter permease [Pedobacter sp.]|uniref:ABC transporter permease n=1 Tax=Pedobacter sp. TaxID=1411316 RepID=UPI002BA4363B|nr:ABC transporter permease [Pedobacter sp.]HMI05153.1 ABC transporter permease [Pedobacter sp.]
MLKNYFKIAIAVLLRRKFFTFISLFGISFTLTILMTTTALLDNVLSPSYPDYKRDRSLYADRVTIKNSEKGWINGSSMSLNFIKRYISTLKKPEKIAFYTFGRTANAYVNNKKINVEFKYTNDAYWDVAEYDFLEGKSYTKQQLDNAERVTVISERTKKAYFGDLDKVAGKFIELDNVNYRVVGVVKGVPRSNRNYYGDVYLPYTVSKSKYEEQGLMGNFGVTLLAKSEADLPAVRAEYKKMLSKVPNEKDFDKLYAHADTIFEDFARRLFGTDDSSGFGKMIIIVTLSVLLFLLLPTINLVNINVTRIIERSSEIGVRKAFGASSKTLVYQFLVENIILTLLGGILGILLSLIVIYFFNQSSLIPDLKLSLNFTVLSVGLGLCLIFGLMSGVYPAWRMSRLNVVSALKVR